MDRVGLGWMSAAYLDIVKLLFMRCVREMQRDSMEQFQHAKLDCVDSKSMCIGNIICSTAHFSTPKHIQKSIAAHLVSSRP